MEQIIATVSQLNGFIKKTFEANPVFSDIWIKGEISNFKKHYSSTTLERKTDYVKLAEAFGAKAYRATEPDGFEKIFREAMSIDGPVLIDCAIDKDEFVLPMLPPGGSIDEMIEKIGGDDNE